MRDRMFPMRLRQTTEIDSATAICLNCDWEHDYKDMNYQRCRRLAREHIRATGHTMKIKPRMTKLLYPAERKDRIENQGG